MYPFPILITCEHASPSLPDGINLGLSDAQMLSHISYDRGALRIAEALGQHFDMPIHQGMYSRLWVDLNRRDSNPTVILDETYGIAVPGNRGLSADSRAARIANAHRPYRIAAYRAAEALVSRGRCLHLSIHSFDPSLDPTRRNFDVGVLFDAARSKEQAWAEGVGRALQARQWSTRFNEPYQGTPEGLTSWLRESWSDEVYWGFEIEANQGWMNGDEAAETQRFAQALAESVSEFAAERWSNA